MKPSATQTGQAAVATPGKVVTGPELLAGFTHAAKVIADHREQLNALNVFPVPDGDTGTNMSLTMRSALDAVHPDDRHSPHTAENVASQVAFGSLMGARGNSGVILSQILRGFSTAIEGRAELDAGDIVHALEQATEVAYKAVANPVEGTMLSVIGDAARAARKALASASDAVDVLVAAADGAEEGLAHTPEALEVLRQAHVVDAGGQGVTYILRAIANSIRGDLTEIQIGEREPLPALANLPAGVASDAHFFGEPGYCTNFMVFGVHIDVDAFREKLSNVGTSVVVVGDQYLIKVHVHTNRPDEVLGMSLALGALDRISIDNMERQVSDIADSLAMHEDPFEPEPFVMSPQLEGEHAVVTVGDGQGFVDILLTMGASAVVLQRDEAKPSTEELLRAVDASPVDDVVLLPNASETIAAAEIVADLSDKHVVIVPSTSVIAGIEALSAMNPSADIETNAKQMSEALEKVRYAEIATASRDAEVDGIAVQEGDLLFFANGTLTASGSALPEILESGLAEFVEAQPEVIAVFTGRDADPAQTATLEETIAATFPESDLEVLSGGQSFYQYIISFE
jgi:DAK2 domain fusion protein YloV